MPFCFVFNGAVCHPDKRTACDYRSNKKDFTQSIWDSDKSGWVKQTRSMQVSWQMLKLKVGQGMKSYFFYGFNHNPDNNFRKKKDRQQHLDFAPLASIRRKDTSFIYCWCNENNQQDSKQMTTLTRKIKWFKTFLLCLDFLKVRHHASHTSKHTPRIQKHYTDLTSSNTKNAT